jgi:hypothetical protein
MADFVAVIRRAVDGLATNTPEARERVYEKARGAVQRQLENMKPRPPEEMLRRQLDKLEAAISSVETEHSEALPAEPEVAAAAVAHDDYHEPAAAEEPAQPEAVVAPEVVEPEPVEPEPASYTPAYRDEEPAEPEPVVAANQPEQNYWQTPSAAEEEPVTEPHGEAEAVIHSEVRHQPETVSTTPETHSERYGDWRDDVPAEHRAVEPEVAPAPVAVPHSDYAQPASATFHSDELHGRVEPVAAERHAPTLDWPPHGDHAAGPAQAEPEQWWPEPAAEPAPQAADSRAPAGWDEVDEITRHLDTGRRAEPVEAHFGEEMHVSAEPVRMPPVTGIPAAAEPVRAAAANEVAEDPFEAYVNAQPAAPAQHNAAPGNAAQDERDPWSDLEDLIGYSKDGPAAAQKPQAAPAADDDFSDLLSPPAKPYRVTPVRKRNYAGIILGLIALLILAGGAYGVWMYRDSLNDMVGGLISKSTVSTQTAQQTPAATPAPKTPTNAVPQTPAAQPQQSASTPAAAHTNPAPADGSATAAKFTQRLTENGSEVDTGPGETSGLAQNAEGQSVAQLNTPPANPANPSSPAPAQAAPSSPAATPPVAGAAAVAPAIPSATPSDTPAVSGEKMFLYEERIGQSAPTAIDGTVSWSLQHEASSTGGPPEAVVQGRITVPGRGLTALLTLKRNNDSSLPASHLIEIVFAVPPDFEGGAIDSVLRIAMKQTEQDRGNALVAVPAKITDDFHMIALNDFPDAQKTNIDLLSTRNWMDIPLAYRNGRRALLTLQKGPEGKKAFDDAIREWSQTSAPRTGQ